MSQINDAVLVPFEITHTRQYVGDRICRVVAVTRDGRAVVSWRRSTCTEETPGEWAIVGRFRRKSPTFLQALFNIEPEWEFIPEEQPPSITHRL